MLTKAPPRLIFTIDVEEEGLFRGHFPRKEATVRNVPYLERLLPVLARFSLPVTLFCTHRVFGDKDARAALDAMRKAVRTEIAAHLHHWDTPPLEDNWRKNGTNYISPGALPPDLFRQRLKALFAAGREYNGAPLTSFRMGRWHLHRWHWPFLAEAGVLVDSSVRPLHCLPQGPDFFDAPAAPYYVPVKTARIIESPMTCIPLYKALPGQIRALAPKAKRGWRKPEPVAPGTFAQEHFTQETVAPGTFASEHFTPGTFAQEHFTQEPVTPGAFTPEHFTQEPVTPGAFTPEHFTPGPFMREDPGKGLSLDICGETGENQTAPTGGLLSQALTAVKAGLPKWGVLQLTPVYHPLWLMQLVTRIHLARGGRFLSLTCHSSELMPGGAPHIPDEAAAAALAARLEGYFAWLHGLYAVKGMVLDDLRRFDGIDEIAQGDRSGDWIT